METRAILHRGRPLDCFPTSESGMYIRLRAARGDLDEAVVVYSDNKFEWTTKPRLERRMELLRSDELYDYFGAELALEDTRLAYVFRLRSGGEVSYLCEEGLGPDFAWDLGYFNYFQYPYIHSSDVMRVPEWTRGAVCYQIFPDRFRIGSGGKDRGYINLAWGGRPEPTSFAGGDLRGIEEGLDHLAETGVSCIYMTPVFLSPSNHKYDVEDYYRVDPRFGGDGALRSLIAAAHGRGMRVVLDGVFNHVGRSFPAFRDALAGHGHESMFHITRNAGGGVDYRRFEGHPELPELNHDSEEVVRLVTDVMLHWLRRGASAWRLDAAYAVSPAFWTRVLPAVRREFPDVWIMGEVIHGDYPAIVRQSGMDSLTQYELWKAIWSSLESANFYELDWSLKRHNEFLESFAPQTFVGNHDVTRIASRVGDAGASLAMTVLFTVGGVPSIYYGDEQAFRGVKEDRMGGDDAVRPAFPASPDDLPGTGEWMYRLIQGLIGIRRRNPWLTHAMTTPVTVDNRRYAYDAVGHGGERLHVELSLDPAPHAVVSGSDGTVLMRVQHGD